MNVVVAVAMIGAFVALSAMIIVRQRRMASRVRGARWVKTDEVFEDPRTGRSVRVWIDPADGSSHYVPEGPLRKRDE